MRAASLLTLCIGLASVQAHADSNEDRLRDALRQSVMQMRAAQDQAAQAQADLQKAQQDKAALQVQFDAATAKLAEPAVKPSGPSPDLARMQAELDVGRAQNTALQQALAKYRLAYQGVTDQARGLDAARQQAQSGLKANTDALTTCKAENTHLIEVSEGVLHLYESQDFRSILLRSYEPLIGSARVKLENMVQDYDDKIHDQEYVPAATHRR